MMTKIDFNGWLGQVRAALAELASVDLGYPLGANVVRERSTAELPDLPSPLDALYRAIDGVSLPDVHVGYFIDPADRVASAAERGEPTLIEGDRPIAIHVFGSDGGGGRFALGLSDGAVYYLPSSGAVKEGRYLEDTASPVRQVAVSVSDFLDRLKADIEAFIRGDKHDYMAH
jgi:hypothetical protein